MSEISSFSLRKILPITIFASGNFAWWFLITIYFNEIFSHFAENNWIYVLAIAFYGSGAISAILGSIICKKIKRKKFLIIWIIFGILATISLLFVQQNLVFAFLTSNLLGISIGLGFPSSMAIISDYTSKNERARFIGIMVLETFIMIFLGIVILTPLKLGLIGIIIIGIIIRGTSFFGFSIRIYDKPIEKGSSWLSILTNRNLIFYLLPWLAFNLAGELVFLIWTGLFAELPFIEEAYNLANPIRMAIIAFLGPIAGITADRVGRKPLIIFALVILGIGFGFLGLATSVESVYFYVILSGIAWTLLMVSYFALFGDVASSKSSEKFYALGLSTPLIAYTLVRGILPSLSILDAEVTILSPIMSILLFLAVIPVLYVPDTLSADIIQERKFREHTDKVRKLISESENK